MTDQISAVRRLAPVEVVSRAKDLADLQRAAYLVEAELIGDDRIPQLTETPAELVAEDLLWHVVETDGQVVAAVAHSESHQPSHVPDILLVHVDRTVTLVDVKPAELLDKPAVRAQFDWTHGLCRDKGWHYEVYSGGDPVVLRNIKALPVGRRPERLPAVVLDQARAVLAPGDVTLSEAVARKPATCDDASWRVAVLGCLWRGVARPGPTCNSLWAMRRCCWPPQRGCRCECGQPGRVCRCPTLVPGKRLDRDRARRRHCAAALWRQPQEGSCALTRWPRSFRSGGVITATLSHGASIHLRQERVLAPVCQWSG